MDLLTKAREINSLLQKTGGQAVSFKEMAEVLEEIILSNIYVVSRKGKILGYGIAQENNVDEMHREVLREGRFPEEYNEQLKSIRETRRQPG